ncbi:MAG: SpoIIE family protein phosphatase [Phycisphaerales bacterium]|nr:MAG: SpoIIE family protein phosphatase [Phycisphaerales bacterium]
MSGSRDQQVLANLKLLLEVSRRMGASTELQPLLENVADAGCQVLQCERATVFLLDRDRHELYSKVATGVQEIRFPADKGISGQVATTGQVSNVPDAYADPRFNPDIDRSTGFRTRNILTVPLNGLQEQRIGVLQLLNKRGGPFGEEDEELALTLGAQAGVALQRQMLLDQYAEKLRIERELDIARDIQQQLLPREDPRVPGYRIAGWNKPADQTGGDCYDFLEARGNRFGVLLADATGHGITAAMCISQFRSLVKATARLSDDLPRIATHVNDLLAEDLPNDRFVTAFLGALDLGNHELTYIAAGQGPLLHYHHASGRTDVLPAGDVPLGIMEGHLFEVSNQLDLAPGDVFCLLTDGFYEWARPDTEHFGEDRVVEIIRANAALPPDRLIQHIYQSVLAFASGTTQADDLTAIVIQRCQD